MIGYCIAVAGFMMSGWQQLRMLRFTQNQKRLKRKYRLNTDTPLSSYGPELEETIREAALEAGRNARFAFTSGSASSPKQILYTRRRLRAHKLVFSDMFARACRAFRIKRTSLYVFSSFEPDRSLTSLLLNENDLPAYLSTLQAPYRVQAHPSMRALAAEYGSAAVRLWILTIANPGVIYSTNPSTMSTFFDELSNHWRESSKLIKDWCEDPKQFNSEVRRIASRIDSLGSKRRLQEIAISDAPIAIRLWAPALEAYICWNGGYVKPFLDRLQKYLPPPRYRHIPMYSTSTETLETVSYFRDNDVFFIPMADGVVYEFVDETDRLIGPTQLKPGKTYAMVVSDPYGLRRYQTGDLFFCRRKVKGLPDLVFVKRRALEYSFTGEKLTAEQLSITFAQLRKQFRGVLADKYLTCVPSQPAEAIPHYKVLLIGEQIQKANLDLLAARCDELLNEINCEYKSKRASGCLGAVRVMQTGVKDFVERFSRHGSWETQFKFLPLWQHTWESSCPHLPCDDSARVS
jgi:hypothetical protein